MDNKQIADAHSELMRQLQLGDAWARRVYPSSESSLFTKTNNAIPTEHDVPAATRARRPFYLLLRIIGALPFTITKDGIPHVKILSLISVYSVAFYTLMMFFIWNEVSSKFNISGGRLDEVVDSFALLVFHLKYAFIPIFLWLPIRRMIHHQQLWNNFQTNFVRTTGVNLEFQLYKYTQISVILIPVLSFIIVAVWVNFNFRGEPWLIPVYALPLITSLSFSGLWGTSYIILAHSADHISAALKRHLHKLRGDSAEQAAVVREHRGLWLELCRLLQSNNDVSTVTFSYHTAHVFLVLTLSLYSLLNGLRAPWNGTQTSRIATCLLFLFELWFLANTAHFTASKFEALQWDPAWVAPDPKTHPEVLKEIATFLDVAAVAPSSVNIGGFVVINRSWLTNMLGNLLSSIIILLQFKVSQSDVATSVESTNSTNTSSVILLQ